MTQRNRIPEVHIIKNINTVELSWCDAAVLVGVANGKGMLRQVRTESARMALALNGQSLVTGRMPGCSTSEGLLAAGHGTHNAGCAELKAAGQGLNEGVADIASAVDVLSPLLGLLEDGLYVVADVPHCPTDGSGRFFWDAPAEMAGCPAMSMVCTGEGQYTQGTPSYLYPSQSAGCHDAARVRHYMERYQQGASPHAVAYHLSGFLSVLLDGHHKAAAAALLGERVFCYTILRRRP